MYIVDFEKVYTDGGGRYIHTAFEKLIDKNTDTDIEI